MNDFYFSINQSIYPLNLSSFIKKSKNLSHPVGITGVAVVAGFSMEIVEAMDVLEWYDNHQKEVLCVCFLHFLCLC